MTDDKHLIRTRALPADAGEHGRHPLNPDSEMRIVPLSDQLGLKRVHVKMIRIPPGKQSFIPHAHSIEEEYVFVIEGRGTATLDEAVLEIGPGDFLAFPTDGVVHHLTNTGEADLVYLTGGERSPVEVARMPTVGKVSVFKDNSVTFYDEDVAQRVTLTEWLERTKIS